MIRYRLLQIAAGVVGVLLLYLVAGLVGGAMPANAGVSAPATGIAIYVEDNGIHTGIAVPVRAGGVDWDRLAPPRAFPDPRYAAHGWRSFGWGDRAFYIGTPTWWDVNPLVILRATVGSGGSVLHVEAIPQPRPGAHVRRIVLTPAQYRRLARAIAAAFARGAPLSGYGPADAFFPAHGRYSALRTCNAWTGATLRTAGVRMGRWTPFPVTVMWWLPR